MMKRLVSGLMVAGLLVLFSVATPQISHAGMQAVYQVFLVNSEGAPVNAPVSVTVSFYDAASGGSPYWSETQTVTPESGHCVVNLGNGNPFNLSFDIPYYLGVQVGAGAETTPRLLVQGPGSFSQTGSKTNDQQLNVKYEWLDINVQ
jgi:hypothetical protein